ncbi:MAG: hypothetical protein GDA53_05560 [Rhodobacteraceae bacterium]|nr:hypothetical protein [Paracoccaceae bacterium]
MGKSAIDRFMTVGRIRVWSVIVTIFGDAVLPRGGVAPSAALSELTRAIGVKPEAFRVALSRLTRDGWIERSKEGRRSYYRLSAHGLTEFGHARRRIYARAPGTVECWQMTCTDGAGPDGHVEVAPRLWVGPRSYVNGALVMTGDLSLPDWARAKMADKEVYAGYAVLARVLEDTLGTSAGGDMPGLQAAATRTLAIHQWRRLVLRHGDWPAHVFPAGWQGEVCRARLHDMLQMLDPAAQNWFDANFQHPG